MPTSIRFEGRGLTTELAGLRVVHNAALSGISSLVGRASEYRELRESDSRLKTLGEGEMLVDTSCSVRLVSETGQGGIEHEPGRWHMGGDRPCSKATTCFQRVVIMALHDGTYVSSQGYMMPVLA